MSEKRFQCVVCFNKTGARFDKCPRCDQWGTCTKITAETFAKAILPTLDTFEAHEPVRLSIGREWDDALGGGLAMGTSLAIWSRPGVGKTTECLRIASAAPRALFLESEFNDLGKLRRFAEAARIPTNTITPLYVESARAAAQMISAQNWNVAVVDSLNALCGASATRRELKETLESLRTAAEKSRSTLLVILQVNRSGGANAPTWVEHMVDTTLSISRTKITVTKNRYGERGQFPRTPRRPQLVAIA